MPFLCPNFVNQYNHDMNSVDQADYLRKSYQMGQGLRNRKWWWSIFMWAFDVSLVNAYLCYKSWHEMHGRKPMSHYRFREQVALAWLDSDVHWPTRYSKRPRTHKKKPSEAIINSRSSKSVSSLSSCQTRSTRTKDNSAPKRKSCRSLNQAALDKGCFDSRLILNDEKTHLPVVPSSGHSDCQIHKWAGKRTRKQVAYCPDCNVCLCIRCYKIFHTVLDLRRVKADIENDKEVSSGYY